MLEMKEASYLARQDIELKEILNWCQVVLGLLLLVSKTADRHTANITV